MYVQHLWLGVLGSIYNDSMGKWKSGVLIRKVGKMTKIELRGKARTVGMLVDAAKVTYEVAPMALFALQYVFRLMSTNSEYYVWSRETGTFGNFKTVWMLTDKSYNYVGWIALEGEE
jgi:hypothetical protein